MIVCPTQSMNIAQKLFKLLTFSLVPVWLLSACSGGISGTGDGSNIIKPNEQTDAELTDTSVIPEDNLGGQTDGEQIDTTDNSADNIGDKQQIAVQLLASGLTNALDAATTQLDEEARSSSQNTITLTLEARIRAYVETASLVSNDITVLNSVLSESISRCSNNGPCGEIPVTTVIQTGDTTVIYSSIEYHQGISGYFDKSLSFMRENGDVVRLQWNNNEDLISLYINTENHTTYSLEDHQRPSLTFRRWDKASQSLTQASIVAVDDIQTTIEADLIDWYVKARLIDRSIILYALNNTNNTLRREAISQYNTGILTERCSAEDCVWQPQYSFQSSVFEGSDSTVGNFSQSYIESLPEITFSRPIERFVIAEISNGDAPLSESIACGGTTVQGLKRFFCWKPLPLPNHRNQVFEEILTNGVLEYRQAHTP